MDSENIHNIKSTLQTLSQPRRPFGTTSINVIDTTAVSTESIEVTHNTITTNATTYLTPCPKCGSPARKIDVHKAHCNFSDYNCWCQ